MLATMFLNTKRHFSYKHITTKYVRIYKYQQLSVVRLSVLSTLLQNSGPLTGVLSVCTECLQNVIS